MLNNSRIFLLSNKLHVIPSYIVFAGLLVRLATPHIPIALAESGAASDYGLLALEAVQSPVFEFSTEVKPRYQYVVQATGFVQAFSPIEAELKLKSNSLTVKKESAVKKTFSVSESVKSAAAGLKRVVVTAYSSTVDQTDSSPFITANGIYVYDGLIACNFLPFGTKVKFPEVFGDKVFTVNDRMNKRHNEKMDIWFPDRQSALRFGKKVLAYEIVS